MCIRDSGICTMIYALCGGVVPNTVWLGHAGLKKSNAGIGYSLVSGIVLGAAGIFGPVSYTHLDVYKRQMFDSQGMAYSLL